MIEILYNTARHELSENYETRLTRKFKLSVQLLKKAFPRLRHA